MDFIQRNRGAAFGLDSPFWSPGGSEGSCDYRADFGDVHHTIPVVWLGLTTPVMKAIL